MSFDKELSRRARAEEALDRLRDLRKELRETQQELEEQRDLRLRLWSLVAIAVVVAYAVYQL